MTRSALHRRTALVTTATLAGVLAGVGLAAPAHAAAPVAVAPARIINTGTGLPLTAIADDGTIYAAVSSSIEVWSPSSNGAPTITKTFTGVSNSGVPSLSSTGELAYAGSGGVKVLDTGQADGPAVAVRTITGANTQLDSPADVAFTPDGSLWVFDVDPSGYELLRFAPGADGNVAPVKQIGGSKTGLESDASLGISTIAGLPGNAVAVAPAGVEPGVRVFGGTQSGNVKPIRSFQVTTPGPHFLSEGIAADPQGRIYIGYGDIDGNRFGQLDVFGPTATGDATPLLSLGGVKQRFQIPLVPTVAPNGTLALTDATILDLGGSSSSYSRVKVFKPLFTKPGAPQALQVKKAGKTLTMTWKAGTNPSGTPLGYSVVVTKGAKTVLSTKVGSTRLVVKRASLPKGKLRVTVKAVNVGGTSGAAAKGFKN